MVRRPINQTLLHLVGPLVIGVVFLAAALVQAASSCLLLLNGTSTKGHVIGLVRQEGSAGDEGQETVVVFAPVFVFAAENGKEFTVRSKAGSNPPAYAVGQEVRVLYRKGDPGSARIATFGQLWGVACGFSAAGVVLSAVGGVLLAWGRSRIRPGLPTTNDEWSERWAAQGRTTWF